MGPPRCGGIAPRRLAVVGLRREFVRLVVFVVVVFVCGSSGVVAVSARSGRRVSGSALRVACRSRVRVWLGGAWVRSWRVRGACARVRAVLRGSRLAVASRVVRGGSPFVFSVASPRVWRARAVSFRVCSVLFRLRAVRRGLLPLRFSFRRWRGLLPLRALAWGGLPPRVAGRVGVARVGSRFLAWVLVRFGSRRAFWAVVPVAGGLWPVVLVRRGGGGGGGGRRPSAVPSVFSASGGGSVLWLSSPAVVSAVASGVCPLSLALRVFRWPVRSAVLWSVWAALSSPRLALAGVPRPLLASVARAALWALGWRFSAVRSVRGLCRGAFRGSSVGAFLAARSCSVALPAVALSWAAAASFSSSALVAALRALVRCLGWLAARSGGRVSCPPALRPALASVARAALRALGC